MFLLHIYTVVGVMGRDGGIGHRAYRYKPSDARKAVIQWTTVYRKQVSNISVSAYLPKTSSTPKNCLIYVYSLCLIDLYDYYIK